MANSKQYTLLFLSGGTGSRMGSSVPKQYMELAGKPIVMHILERIERIESIAEIVIVCAPEYREHLEAIILKSGIKKRICFANAGNTRQESVRSGLREVTSELMILHEAARPFVKQEDFERLIDFPKLNATFGRSIPFSVIRGHSNIEGILDRTELVNVQLPQKFETRLLKEAHEKAFVEKKTFTEDAGMIFHYFPQVEVGICEGPEYDIKLTTPMDFSYGNLIYNTYFS